MPIWMRMNMTIGLVLLLMSCSGGGCWDHYFYVSCSLCVAHSVWQSHYSASSRNKLRIFRKQRLRSQSWTSKSMPSVRQRKILSYGIEHLCAHSGHAKRRADRDMRDWKSINQSRSTSTFFFRTATDRQWLFLMGRFVSRIILFFHHSPSLLLKFIFVVIFHFILSLLSLFLIFFNPDEQLRNSNGGHRKANITILCCHSFELMICSNGRCFFCYTRTPRKHGLQFCSVSCCSRTQETVSFPTQWWAATQYNSCIGFKINTISVSFIVGFEKVWINTDKREEQNSFKDGQWNAPDVSLRD